ncbi:MAG: hypothetical protein HZA15_02465 [Nitrospirae bacterium]|nr:hypothetical protein [Nitrospirota bacterium]
MFNVQEHRKCISEEIGEEQTKQLRAGGLIRSQGGGISSVELRRGSKRRKVSGARAQIALRGRDELGLTSAEIARHVGVNSSSISRTIDRAEKRSEAE